MNNRRTFLKQSLLTGAVLATTPLWAMSQGTKRSTRSLYTQEELRLWCRMNGFKYLEDRDITWDVNPKFQTKLKWYHQGEKKYHIYGKWPFLHRNQPKQWYEALRWVALEFKFQFEEVFFYDIVDTTLDFLVNPTNDGWFGEGEFYSLIQFSGQGRSVPNCDTRKERMLNIGKIYDLKTRSWIKPVLNTNDGWWSWSGFELV